MRRPLALALTLVSSLAGCSISRASSMPVSKELAADCARHCGILEMRLAAVVIVSSAGGCVCEPVSAPAAPAARAGAVAAAGGAIVTSISAEQKQQQASVTSTPAEAPSVR